MKTLNKSQLLTLANKLRATGISLSEAFKEAWRAWRIAKLRDIGVSLSEAFKQACRISELRVAMLTRPVKFSYKKKDGSTRIAFGTLQAKFMPATKGSGRVKPATQIIYFDLGANGFRSFVAGGFIKFV